MEKKKEIDEILDRLTRWFEKNEKERTVMVVVSDKKEKFQVGRVVLGNNIDLSIALMTVMRDEELFAKVISEAFLTYIKMKEKGVSPGGFWQEIEDKFKSMN